MEWLKQLFASKATTKELSLLKNDISILRAELGHIQNVVGHHINTIAILKSQVEKLSWSNEGKNAIREMILGSVDSHFGVPSNPKPFKYNGRPGYITPVNDDGVDTALVVAAITVMGDTSNETSGHSHTSCSSGASESNTYSGCDCSSSNCE